MRPKEPIFKITYSWTLETSAKNRPEAEEIAEKAFDWCIRDGATRLDFNKTVEKLEQ